MSYLGRGSNLTRKAQDKVSFLATAGQTVRTGLSYVPTHVDVTVNGITLTEITDYTATNGNSITFTVALALNDEVTIVSSKTFDVANHYTISAANALLAAKATNTAVALKAPIASPVFTGNVGIGSSSPVRQLEIKDDGTRGQAIVGIIADAGDPAGIFMGTTSNNNVGGIRYFTDTNKLALRANDEDRLLIDSSGIVTKPYQPAFKQAWGSLNAGSSRILSTNSGLTAKTDRDVFNTGNHFSAATGRFTAPVAGTFLLGFSFMRNGANGAGADIRIKKNGSRIYSRHYKANYVQAYETSSTTVISKCAVNDYFTFEISASDSLYEDDAFQFGYLLG